SSDLDAVKKAEANVNSLEEELSAACARVEVLEQSLQPASGSSLAAIHNYQPIDVSEVLNIESGWETAIAALLAGSRDRAWLESLDSGVAALGTLKHKDVSDIRIFYRSQLANEQMVDDTERLPASYVISERKRKFTAVMALRSYLVYAVLVEYIQEARVLV